MDEETLGGRHLLEYWAVVRRRRHVVYLAVAAAALVALVGSFLATPLYRSTVTLEIERQNPEILTFRDVKSVDYAWSAYTDFYQTQYKILASDAVARRTVARLGLVNHPAFAAGERRRGPIARLLSLLPSPAAPAERDPVEIAAARLRAGLEVSPIRNSTLVALSWVSPDPALAARVANGVVDAFVQFNIESKYTTSDQATEFLVNQIGTLKKEIDGYEERLQRYGESKGIVTIDDASNITIKALSDISERRTEAQATLAQKEAAYKAILGSPPEALPDVLHSDLISRLKQEYAGYEAEVSEKSRRFKDDWPGMQALKSRLDQARDRLEIETREIARKVVLSAEADYRRVREEVLNLDALLSRQQQAAQTLKRDGVEFANLQSEVRKKRETLNALIARQSEMALSTRLKDLDATSSNVRVVDRARTPASPFRPNKRLNLVLGLLLGLALGVGTAFFLDYLDNTLSSPSEIEPLVGLPSLAVIPRHGPHADPLARMRRKAAAAPSEAVDLVSFRDGGAGASEAYRELRTALLLSSAGSPPRRIMVTSALPEEGKSATAINLAVVLAQAGRRVLLADTDLRRPRLHRVFGKANSSGMSTYLSGLETDPLRLVIATGIERLDLVTSGPIPPNPSELLNAPIFEEAGKRFLDAGYDHVVFDSPPVLSVADPVIIASVMDGVILVTRAGRTPRQSLKAAVEKFLQAGIRPAGVVLNDLDAEMHGYAHYRYRYHGRYGHSESSPDDGGREKRAGGTRGV
jgi:succinoglycan biosynthesis transport protein ExoP